MTTIDFESLTLTSVKKSTPSWLKQANKGNGRCTKCKVEYLKGELNDKKHCRHCADELHEAHLFND